MSSNGYNRKTFDGSYLFNMQTNANQKNMIDYILHANRIDKYSDAFKPIADEIKRNQTSAILYYIMMDPSIVLMINKKEMPRSFKVFEAKDLKNDKDPKIFIDVTKLIQLENGYFTCKKIDIFITYLFGALNYKLYRENIDAVINNSNLTISGTECFVSMFSYIIDYLRIIGYSANKEKILYMVALYYLTNLLDKKPDNYTMQIAAKISGIDRKNMTAYNLYIDDGCFNDIDSFIKFLADTFKLKGLTTEVFIQKWMFLFGTGTQYGTELFTSFAYIIVCAYCGTYVVNQKQIERCCGSSMVSFANTILKLAADLLDISPNTIRKENYTVSTNASIIKEELNFRNKKVDAPKYILNDLDSTSKAKKVIEETIKVYKDSGKENKLDGALKKILKSVYSLEINYILLNNTKLSDRAKKNLGYDLGEFAACIKLAKPYLSDKTKKTIIGWIGVTNNNFPTLEEYKSRNKFIEPKMQAKIYKDILDSYNAIK